MLDGSGESMLTRGNIFIVGQTGCGKTTLAQKIVKSSGGALTHVRASAWLGDGASAESSANRAQILTENSIKRLRANPDACVELIRGTHNVSAGGLVIDGIRNPRDFAQLFDARRDQVIVISWPHGGFATEFERSGILAIESYIEHMKVCGLIENQPMHFTIDSVDGQTRSCAEERETECRSGSLREWNMNDVWEKWIRWLPVDKTWSCGSVVHVDVPSIECSVAAEYLYDMDVSYTGKFVPCKIFSASSYVGHELTFQALIENQYVFSYLPARAFRFSYVDGDPVTGSELVYAVAPSGRIVVNCHAELCKHVQCFFRTSGSWRAGRYLFTIDWIDDNQLLHALALDTGQLALMPSHKIRFENPERTPLPKFKKMNAEWK